MKKIIFVLIILLLGSVPLAFAEWDPDPEGIIGKPCYGVGLNKGKVGYVNMRVRHGYGYTCKWTNAEGAAYRAGWTLEKPEELEEQQGVGTGNMMQDYEYCTGLIRYKKCYECCHSFIQKYRMAHPVGSANLYSNCLAYCNKLKKPVEETRIEERKKEVEIKDEIKDIDIGWLKKFFDWISGKRQEMQKAKEQGKEESQKPSKFKKKQEKLITAREATKAYQDYIDAYNKYTDLVSEGKGDSPEAQIAYKGYKETKERYEAIARGKKIQDEEEEETETKSKYNNPYLLDEEIDETKEAIETIKDQIDTLKDVLGDGDKKKALEDFSKSLEKINDNIENIEKFRELVYVIRGKEIDWRDTDWDDVKPGLIKKFGRGIINIFVPYKYEKATEVQDFYKEMSKRKKEADFYSLPLKERLKVYAYQKFKAKMEKYAEDTKEKAADVMKDIMGKSGQFAAWSIIKPIEVIYEEMPKGQIGAFYKAYVEYRKGKSHEQAIENMKRDMKEGGIWTGSLAGLQHHEGYEEQLKRALYGMGDEEVLMEAFKKVYEKEMAEKKEK